MSLSDWVAKHATARLRQHDITLIGEHVTLRPLSELDWNVLFRWNNDPEVLYFAEGEHVNSRTMEEVQAIYRGVSQTAFYFMIELGGTPVGECQLQEMNLRRILDRHAGKDCRRIDIIVGEKDRWGQGIGTEAIRLLVRLGFEQEGADAIFACDIADDNPRSRRAFEKAGFIIDARHEEASTSQRHATTDMVLTRERYARL